MKVKIILLALVTLALNSCEQYISSKQQIKVNDIQKNPVIANAEVSFEVKGMVCKMACGGSIRKTLIHSGAVERVEINFVEAAKSQEVIVHYDSTKMSPTALKSLIENTNDGQFTVIAEKSSSASK
jgi:hypothetical protein